ncbi:hypothetical protein TorRG33x02_151550 [Trema orientale]|uniref:Uncharacterized protein n=1 Tax=Trema orientale TaxID=63057 RepID=A0A2P5EU52_TREOI|nr:hypothetical protein TorRG33x02_151550 [Trema orientale]
MLLAVVFCVFSFVVCGYLCFPRLELLWLDAGLAVPVHVPLDRISPSVLLKRIPLGDDKDQVDSILANHVRQALDD